MIDLWVPLPADWVAGRELGRQRQAALDRAGMSSKRTDADAARENIIGAVGELALSRALRVPMPPFWAADGRGDPGWDLPTVLGTLDVKGVAAKPWFLPAKDSALAKRPGADLYALVWCPEDEPTCELVGFVTRAEMEAGTWSPHVLDPLGRKAWRADPAKPDITPVPGRWLYASHERQPAEVHDAQVLLDGIARGVPASLWRCPWCRLSAFAALRPVCDFCDRRMVEANTYAVLRSLKRRVAA